MDKVYVCENCWAIGRYKVDNCPKCRGFKILEIPFDGKWVLVKDADCRRKLQEAYDRQNDREMGW